MKFRFFSIFALAGSLLSSCAVDELPTKGGSIVAEMETDQTKTTVTDVGVFTWSDGDKVWLHTTSGGAVGTLSDGAGTSSAKFSYAGFIGEMTGKAVCPYNSGHSISEDVLNFVLPASYDLGSSLTNTNAAMYGVNVGGTIRFNHLAGVMRFRFKNVPAGVNKFTITLDKKINGTFSADLTAVYPIIETTSTSTASEKTTTLNFNTLTENSDISIYVPLPIGTYNSLELGLYDDEKSVWSYSNAVTNTVNRKSLKRMPVVTIAGSISGDLEIGDARIDYIDEYGVNHGLGVLIDETIWAPVNCGYHETDFKYGKLYQWGRKYGQGYEGGVYYYAEYLGRYQDATIPTITNGAVSLEVGQHSSNANIFYKGSSGDWVSPQNNKLWNAGNETNPIKTEYDPCPDGWRVPTYAELKGLIANNSGWSGPKGETGLWFSGTNSYTSEVPRIFLIAAGSRPNYESAGDRGSTGYYWSSRTVSPYSYYLRFSPSSESMEQYEDREDDGNRAFGHSVRCVQE